MLCLKESVVVLCFHFVLIFPQSLFWENNHLLVTSFGENGRRFVPLCNILYGRVGDFLNWCRQTNASGKTSACITRKVSVPIYYGTSLVAQLVKKLPVMQETLVLFLGWEDLLEKGQATHSSILGLPWWLSLKNALAVQETWVRSLGWANPLEKGKATHFSILAWRIPWTV